MELVYGVLLCFEILEDTTFEVTEGIAETEKIKREKEEGKKEYS